MACPDDEVLLDVAEGRRALDSATELHLGVCEDCRRVLAAAARSGASGLADGEAAEGEPSFEELGVGVTVGSRYTLERFLGSGGMGVVWRARPIEDGAPVALKIARSLDVELRRRFEREAQIAATLRHPNVVRTLAVVPATEARGICIVQELLLGEPLAARLERGPNLPLPEAAAVIIAVADALAAAHATGVVHRDLKPQNVFLAETRTVVLDFGIAKLLPAWGAYSTLTNTGAVLGTPHYMAPEQIFGETDIDPRADVWALGVLLYRALSGRLPTSGATLGDIVRGFRSGAMIDLATIVRDLPRDVLELVRSALVIPREGRLSSVEPFRTVLSRWTTER